MLRMQEGKLSFAEVGKPGFVDRGRTQRPGMRKIPLLETLVGVGAETRKIGASGFELGKRIELIVIGEVVVKTELLVLVNPVVQA